MHLVQALVSCLAIVSLSDAAAIKARQNSLKSSLTNPVTRSDASSSCGSNTVYVEDRGCVYDPNANNNGGSSGSGSSSCGTNTFFVPGRGCVFDPNAKSKREHLASRSNVARACCSNTVFVKGQGCVYDPDAKNNNGGSWSSSSCGSNTVFVPGRGCVSKPRN
ncbi:hypothetical protein CC79DRAFT_909565 [Sarocladium strictum]